MLCLVKQLLMDYLEQNNIPVVIRKKRSYLTYEGIPDRYVYILKKGIIKTSVVTHEGREFNLRYMNDFDIVSLFKDESSQEVEAPFNVRVESEEAEYIRSCAINSGQMSIKIGRYKIMSKSTIAKI